MFTMLAITSTFLCCAIVAVVVYSSLIIYVYFEMLFVIMILPASIGINFYMLIRYNVYHSINNSLINLIFVLFNIILYHHSISFDHIKAFSSFKCRGGLRLLLLKREL
eukprot:GHVR01038884.1.p1 GENE.GHVR01038884.1~~GHVR01038884.1.p1  ORF type:complete len:108 (-),score=0.63 GHVR01038884.1:1947-2270(-)